VGLRLYKQSSPLRHVIVFFFIRKHVSFQALLSVNTHNPIFRLLRLFFIISANLSIKESLKLINKIVFGGISVARAHHSIPSISSQPQKDHIILVRIPATSSNGKLNHAP
jgi:hypothetical protein